MSEDCRVLIARAGARLETATRGSPDGESIVEHVAGVEDYQVALATTAWRVNTGGTPITLRQGARVIEDSRRMARREGASK